MRMISYSLLAVAAFGIWEIRQDHSSLQGLKTVEAEAPHGVDATLIGASIPVEHVAGWEARNRLQQVSGGQRNYYQAFPDDEVFAVDKDSNEKFAKDVDMMATGSIGKSELGTSADE